MNVSCYTSETLPTLIDRASRALASARTSAEVLEARDMARVEYDAAKSAGRMARAKGAHDEVIGAVYRAQADALLIEARAKRRLADEYDAAQERGEVATGREGKGLGVARANAQVATAADLGLRRDEIHEARQIRDAEIAQPGVVEDAIQRRIEAGQEPTRAAVKAAVEAVTRPFVANNTGNNEWYTPDEILNAAREVMGGIWLDPASSEIANRRVQATVYFDKDDDGLNQSWQGGTIWLNPPYATGLIGRFADKLVETVEAEPTTAIVLVNNATETAWFQRMASACRAICFPSGRVKFLDPEGNPGAPLQGQAILYFGFEPEKFTAHFDAFGFTVLRHG